MSVKVVIHSRMIDKKFVCFTTYNTFGYYFSDVDYKVSCDKVWDFIKENGIDFKDILWEQFKYYPLDLEGNPVSESEMAAIEIAMMEGDRYWKIKDGVYGKLFHPDSRYAINAKE